ncbi:multicopper oxidase family protein [Tahibacter amnicola]|uniref:Multicopper oxidase domain-containing protein n=1 Tax=Tahibacter amnicola TaxID=2976241 RepID=A0ABY6BN22_9GAMM|nr:multicopper oxidase domain-containing protein [Tahibacter amnicola]UXI70460.1 multicopper oxidase domain-containing protein [Tahibacter amnicola]
MDSSPYRPDRKRRRLLIALAAGIPATGLLAFSQRWFAAPSGASVPPAPRPPAPATEVTPDLKAPVVADSPFTQPLRIPGREGLMAQTPRGSALRLVAKEGAFPLFGGPETALWHYNARIDETIVANPLLAIGRGEPLDVTLENALAEPTTIHWHGLAVDEANDGSGLHPVAPGKKRRYTLRVENRAGLYWYHAHPHQLTGKQIQRGLAGLLLVDDEEELTLRKRLRLPWGERDIPLMISDKQVNDRNEIVYKDNPDDWIGNRVLVNWTAGAYLDVKSTLYRFRLINTSNARVFRPAFLHRGRPLAFHLIGTDGGLLEKPWRVDDLFLAPAQRADVLVSFAEVGEGESVILTSLDYVAMENEDDSGPLQPHLMADHPGAVPMGGRMELMEFRIGAADPKDSPAPLPPKLCNFPKPAVEVTPVRKFRLSLDAEGVWHINDWNMHASGHDAQFVVRRGTCEIWEIHNAMASMPHPIHIHGFQFHVLSRTISPPDIRARAVVPGGLGPQDLGLLDTILVWPGETVRIALDFSQPFKGRQRYMLHCHNLEHEDMGMMVTFAVTDDAPVLPVG